MTQLATSSVPSAPASLTVRPRTDQSPSQLAFKGHGPFKIFVKMIKNDGNPKSQFTDNIEGTEVTWFDELAWTAGKSVGLTNILLMFRPGDYPIVSIDSTNSALTTVNQTGAGATGSCCMVPSGTQAQTYNFNVNYQDGSTIVRHDPVIVVTPPGPGNDVP